jgi:hypothetical protein
MLAIPDRTLEFAQMSSEFRASTPADADEIAAFCRRVLAVPAASRMFSPQHMDWKYWRPWPEGPASRSYVLTRRDRIVAHGAVLPLVLECAPRPLRLMHLYDWAAEPGAIGAGAVLLGRIAALSDAMLIVGGSALTQRMAGPLGFTRRGNVGLFAWRGLASAALPANALPLTGASSVAARSALAISSCRRTTPLLLNYTHCPAARFEAFELQGSAPSTGFMLAFAPAQARIVALWSSSTDAADWLELVSTAARSASFLAPGAEVVCMANTEVESSALSAYGFRHCGAVPMFVKVARGVLPANPEIAFQMLDGDVAFLHHDEPYPWS